MGDGVLVSTWSPSNDVGAGVGVTVAFVFIGGGLFFFLLDDSKARSSSPRVAVEYPRKKRSEISAFAVPESRCDDDVSAAANAEDIKK